jgi:hypothetical protein
MPGSLDSGTLNFPSIAAFTSGTANSFSLILGDRAAYITQGRVRRFFRTASESLHR